MSEALQRRLQAAKELITSSGAAELREILIGPYPNDAESLKVKEAAVDTLVDALIAGRDSSGLRALLTDLRSWFAVIPKAKTAKIVRAIIDGIGKIPDSTQVLVSAHDRFCLSGTTNACVVLYSTEASCP
jgi:26S proteasome regulatory subunit N6